MYFLKTNVINFQKFHVEKRKGSDYFLFKGDDKVKVVKYFLFKLIVYFQYLIIFNPRCYVQLFIQLGVRHIDVMYTQFI